MSLKGPHAKVLEAIWWWIDNDADLNTFLSEYTSGTPHKFKLIDGTVMPAGDVMANECPALTVEPTGESYPITEIKLRGFGPEENASAAWGVTIYGYLNTLLFDSINNFYALVFRAIKKGLPTMFAVSPLLSGAPRDGLLQGADQIIEGYGIKFIHPGGLWINPSDLENSNNTPSISFFAIGFSFQLGALA